MADKVVTLMPEFAAELVAALLDQGHPDLAAQVPELCVETRCPCRDDFCSSFYTVAPDGTRGPDLETVPVEDVAGMVVLDVVDGVIHYVEVLDRPDVDRVLRRTYKTGF